MGILASGFLTIVGALATSCGGDSATTTSTSGNNTRQPAGGAAAQWHDVSEDRSCGDCPAGAGFSVDNNGHYMSGRGASGDITREELDALIAVGNSVAQQQDFSTMDCDSMPAEAGAQVAMTIHSEATGSSGAMGPSGMSGASGMMMSVDNTMPTMLVYDGRNNDTLCHRGDAARAIALKDAIQALATKYDTASMPTGSSGDMTGPSGASGASGI